MTIPDEAALLTVPVQVLRLLPMLKVPCFQKGQISTGPPHWKLSTQMHAEKELRMASGRKGRHVKYYAPPCSSPCLVR